MLRMVTEISNCHVGIADEQHIRRVRILIFEIQPAVPNVQFLHFDVNGGPVVFFLYSFAHLGDSFFLRALGLGQVNVGQANGAD